MNTVRLPRGAWRYDPDQPLGEPGGFGAVFVGLDENGEEVAVKRLHISATQAAHRELRIAEELSGRDLSHVIPIFDAGQDAESDAYYVVMARADRDLQDAIDAGDISSEVEVAGIMTDIVSGLQEVSDIVHRDLKPGNVLYHGGIWKIGDFGIARFVEAATSLRTLKGALSPQYAAPEQWRGERATTATDVYALGCIGYALITERPPFQGPTLEEFQDQHLHQSPPPLQAVSPRLRALLSMMLRKEPRTRPSLDRVLQQLAQLDQDDAKQEGAKKLGQVAAVVAEEKSRVEAMEQTEIAKIEQRRREAVVALDILAELRDELLRRIVNEAPEATPSRYASGRGSLPEDIHAIKLRGAELRVAISQGAIPSTKFTKSGWDVLAGGWIEVKPPTGSYKRSASLWYTNLGSNVDYRWYEVCYMTSAISRRQQRLDQPFALAPGDADVAGSKAVTSYDLAAKPKPIDDEDFDDFCNRWMGLFALAVEGKLEPPRSLPLD